MRLLFSVRDEKTFDYIRRYVLIIQQLTHLPLHRDIQILTIAADVLT